jgi:DNA-binding transcriptional regulator PaaX
MKESDLIFGIMASFARKAYTVTQLKYLLKPFAIGESCLRTTLSRLKQKNMVTSWKQGKKAAYAIFGKGNKIRKSVAHSFHSLDWQTWDQSFWGVVFSVPDQLKAQRYSIRKNLIAYRFARQAKGFWIRPYHPKEAFLLDILAEKHCHVFRFHNLKDVPPDRLKKLWRTEELNRSFNHALQVLAKKENELTRYSPEQALVQKMQVGGRMIDIIFQDPLLPAIYLPGDWKADELRHAFFTWDNKVTEIAKPYWGKIIKEE